MLNTQKEKTILKQAVLTIGIMALLYFFVLSPFLREGSSILDEELDRKTAELKRHIKGTGALPSEEGFASLKKNKDRLEKKFFELKKFLDPEKVRMSESDSEAGLYFIEKLHGIIKEFAPEAEAKAVKLPENLGFGGGLPKESTVEPLLRQLETVETVVGILLESEKIEFSAIKPLRSIEYIEPLSKEILYTELPVQISLKTDTKTLINLLSEIKNNTPVISVKEVHIRSGNVESREIEVSLVFSTFMITENQG